MIEEGSYRNENNNVANNNNDVNEDDDKEFKKPQILVDYLLNVKGEEGKHFTENEIKDHVFTTISAVRNYTNEFFIFPLEKIKKK